MPWWLVYVKQEPYFLNNSFATLRQGLIRVLSWFVATRRGRVIHLLSLPWLALLAWLTSVAWFLTDDAFISFRYVRNLLEGHGLVFNPGEYVEGYTNFLWILELVALWGLFGLRPEQAAPWLSVAYTVGTLAALWWWIARSPSRHDRSFVAWMALGLLCSSATFAVWTSGGGLETRQFTCFIVVAVVCLAVHGSNRWGLLAASLSLAAAALTRPEGLLLAACCFGWFAAQRIIVDRKLDWRAGITLVAPFAVLVTAHFLFRYGYYGDFLPNTYYAKHIRPWYESGFRYLWAAALETGLYLLLPLTWVGPAGALAPGPRWDVCAGAAVSQHPHGLRDADWGRPFRISPTGLLLAVAGAAGRRGPRAPGGEGCDWPAEVPAVSFSRGKGAHLRYCALRTGAVLYQHDSG